MRYSVSVTKTSYGVIEIEADTPEEARSEANRRINNRRGQYDPVTGFDAEDVDYDVTGVS